MDGVGVHCALLVSPRSMHGYDASYALEVRAGHPGRFAVIKPFNIDSESVGEETGEWARMPGAVEARILLQDDETPAVEHEGIDAILADGIQNCDDVTVSHVLAKTVLELSPNFAIMQNRIDDTLYLARPTILEHH